MRKTLKQKIEEAAEGYYPKLEDRWINMAFRAGAQFLLDEGYKYTEADLYQMAGYVSVKPLEKDLHTWAREFVEDKER